jgi:hypothetical protein
MTGSRGEGGAADREASEPRVILLSSLARSPTGNHWLHPMSSVLKHVQVDVTSWVLLGVCGVLLVIGYHLRPSSPACHPFLLGRQAITAKTRLQNQSPVYINASTGGIRSPLRPDKKYKLLQHVISHSLTSLETPTTSTDSSDAGRVGWLQRGDKLAELVKALQLALDNKLGATPVNVALVIRDPAGEYFTVTRFSRARADDFPTRRYCTA